MTIRLIPQAIIYDMDGVLLDSEPLWEQAEQEVLAQFDFDPNQLLAQLGITTTGMRINEVLAIYYRYSDRITLPADELAEQIIHTTIAKIQASKPILPGVIESLQLCHALNLKVALASSSPMVVIDAVTELLGITDYFEQRISAEHLPYGKPHPAVYLQAASELNIDPINCITIEDSIAGMIATKAAKMKSIVVPPAAAQAKPQWALADLKLHSLNELSAQHLQ